MATGLAVGAAAPEFALRDQYGASVRLSELCRGSTGGPVALVFFPYAFSRICTGELGTLVERWPAEGPGTLVGISCDPMFSLRAFALEEGVSFPLLSDFWPHGEVSAAYGVFDDRHGCARRSSYVVAPDGTVAWSVHSAMSDARVVDELLAAVHSAT